MRLSELRAAVTREGPSPEARAVWWAIAAHADGDGEARPSIGLIAQMAGMSTRHVSTKLRELERFGMVETTRLPTHRNRYHVVTSAEPQFRFATGTPVQHPTGTPVQDDLNPSSGRSGNGQLSDLPKRGDHEVHSEVHNEVGAAAPARRGGAAPNEQPAADRHECTSGWVYDMNGDVTSCPTCRPTQYRDMVTW